MNDEIREVRRDGTERKHRVLEAVRRFRRVLAEEKQRQADEREQAIQNFLEAKRIIEQLEQSQARLNRKAIEGQTPDGLIETVCQEMGRAMECLSQIEESEETIGLSNQRRQRRLMRMFGPATD